MKTRTEVLNISLENSEETKRIQKELIAINGIYFRFSLSKLNNDEIKYIDDNFNIKEKL
jgi:hypothetical protein